MKSFLRFTGRLAGLVVFTLILCGVARAQDEGSPPDPYHKSKEPVYLSPQPGRALLYVVRPAYVRAFGLSDFKVFVDDKVAGWLPQRCYLAVQVEPGRRLLWGPGYNQAQRFDFVPGKTYLLVLEERYMDPGRRLDETWWIERNAEEITAIVPANKLQYVTTLEAAMTELAQEAAKKFAKTNEKTRDAAQPVLPATFQNVWYRPEKKKVMLKGFEASGTLTITSETIEFKSDKKSLVIPVKDIGQITQAQFATFGDDSVWDIVAFATDASAEVAGFRDGRSFGPGGPTGLIYRTLLLAAKQNQSAAAQEAHVKAIAGYSEKPPVAAESGPPVKDANAENQPPASPASQPAEVAAPSTPQNKTLASPLLQQDTFRNISLVDIGNTDCEGERRVVKMEVTQQPSGVKFRGRTMVAGTWGERWTIERCGKQMAYDITYRSDGHGGTYIDSKPVGPPQFEKKTGEGTQQSSTPPR